MAGGQDGARSAKCAETRKGTDEARHWKVRAEWAEERLRFVAALLRIPDGARYQADVREFAESVARDRAERDRFQAALRYIDGADVAGWDAHMRPEEVARKALGRGN